MTAIQEKQRHIHLFGKWYLGHFTAGWRLARECDNCDWLIYPITRCYCTIAH